MDLHLKNKVIIVTGGAGLSGSIGEVTVRHIAAEGGIPVIVDKNERGVKLANDIREKHGNAMFVPVDLTTEEGCREAAEQAAAEYGRIDGIVNNLGVNDGVGFDHSYQEFMDSLKLNLAHFFGVTKAALPHLRKSSGSVINIASKVALTGQGGTSGYAAAKGGVLSLTREWALELREDDIRVNAIVIAESFTPSYRTWLEKFDDPEAKKKEISAKVPLGKRMTEPSEIADTILFLLSDRSSHTTGQFVHVDGGYTHLDRAIT
ncbi:SDR family oxidoreductase [Fodinibius salsisoli]|uniref:SDR family oxidoreductase n=1 Tax=Fodinibius salsisoli TaxID=2820877 RepID=A0ABT3PQ14_9BACT|nr:SDR family oxidoreductase [Fodinibius salsisoli]MCW9707941.1 SDR family oxidoreductase [Fodinibius salsisoli]